MNFGVLQKQTQNTFLSKSEGCANKNMGFFYCHRVAWCPQDSYVILNHQRSLIFLSFGLLVSFQQSVLLSRQLRFMARTPQRHSSLLCSTRERIGPCQEEKQFRETEV